MTWMGEEPQRGCLRLSVRIGSRRAENLIGVRVAVLLQFVSSFERDEEIHGVLIPAVEGNHELSISDALRELHVIDLSR